MAGRRRRRLAHSVECVGEPRPQRHAAAAGKQPGRGCHHCGCAAELTCVGGAGAEVCTAPAAWASGERGCQGGRGATCPLHPPRMCLRAPNAPPNTPNAPNARPMHTQHRWHTELTREPPGTGVLPMNLYSYMRKNAPDRGMNPLERETSLLASSPPPPASPRAPSTGRDKDAQRRPMGVGAPAYACMGEGKVRARGVCRGKGGCSDCVCAVWLMLGHL